MPMSSSVRVRLCQRAGAFPSWRRRRSGAGLHLAPTTPGGMPTPTSKIRRSSIIPEFRQMAIGYNITLPTRPNRHQRRPSPSPAARRDRRRAAPTRWNSAFADGSARRTAPAARAADLTKRRDPATRSEIVQGAQGAQEYQPRLRSAGRAEPDVHHHRSPERRCCRRTKRGGSARPPILQSGA